MLVLFSTSNAAITQLVPFINHNTSSNFTVFNVSLFKSISGKCCKLMNEKLLPQCDLKRSLDVAITSGNWGQLRIYKCGYYKPFY